jgi:hypothetical protein
MTAVKFTVPGWETLCDSHSVSPQTRRDSRLSETVRGIVMTFMKKRQVNFGHPFASLPFYEGEALRARQRLIASAGRRESKL